MDSLKVVIYLTEVSFAFLEMSKMGSCSPTTIILNSSLFLHGLMQFIHSTVALPFLAIFSGYFGPFERNGPWAIAPGFLCRLFWNKRKWRVVAEVVSEGHDNDKTVQLPVY